VEWIQLAQDKVQWRVLVNKVTNFRVPQKVERPSALQEKLCSMQLVTVSKISFLWKWDLCHCLISLVQAPPEEKQLFNQCFNSAGVPITKNLTCKSYAGVI
jgi:hypothetical protein